MAWMHWFDLSLRNIYIFENRQQLIQDNFKDYRVIDRIGVAEASDAYLKYHKALSTTSYKLS